MGSKTQKDPKVQLDLLHKTLPLPFTVAFFFFLRCVRAYVESINLLELL